jgi:hypothetical protein
MLVGGVLFHPFFLTKACRIYMLTLVPEKWQKELRLFKHFYINYTHENVLLFSDGQIVIIYIEKSPQRLIYKLHNIGRPVK